MTQHDTLEKLRDFFHAHEPFQLARIDDGRIQLHLTDEQYSVIRAALSATQPAKAAQSEPTLRDYAEDLVDAGHDFWKACESEAGGGAVRWLSCDDGTLIVFTRVEYRDEIMAHVGGYKAPVVVFDEDGMTALEAQAAQSEPVKPLFASKVASRKWSELQEAGARMQSIAFDGHKSGQPGTIDPWGVVRWGQAAQGAGEVSLIAPDAVWLIQYDDADRRPEILTSEQAARAYFKRISDQWNAHLFVKVESNSRDDRFYSRNVVLTQPTTPAQPAPVVPDIKAMAQRLMGWKLPKDFSPDCGISFDGRGPDARGYEKTWPTGTNLLTVAQAEQMLAYLFDATAPTGPVVPAQEVLNALDAWKAAWIKVPTFADRVNKATREAITMSHGPLFKLLDLAHRAIAATPTPPAQAAADARDAERYRLVRRGQHWSVVNGIGDTLRGEDLDAAIDAASVRPVVLRA